ncbi:MAG: hypothetical protein AAGI07_15875 [Bacteroidota bacterium]
MSNPCDLGTSYLIGTKSTLGEFTFSKNLMFKQDANTQLLIIGTPDDSSTGTDIDEECSLSLADQWVKITLSIVSNGNIEYSFQLAKEAPPSGTTNLSCFMSKGGTPRFTIQYIGTRLGFIGIEDIRTGRSENFMSIEKLYGELYIKYDTQKNGLLIEV